MEILFRYLLLISLILCRNLFSQQDIFIKYNAITNEIIQIDSVETDSSVHFDFTDWNFGTMPGIDILPQNAPIITFPGAGFTELIKTDSIFNLTNYPIRTAAKLFGYLNDSLVQQCSGILVAKNLLLTAAHCSYYRFDTTGNYVFLDSIVVIPAFNNGIENANIGKTKSTSFIIPEDWFNRNLQEGWKDISLIELSEDIGELVGWVGAGFSDDDDFYYENLFYKFSYPVGALGFDSSRIFDKNFMYFNYGFIDTVLNSLYGLSWVGYFIPGIPGQSGSCLLLNNNNEFITFGEQVWSDDSKHFRITRRNYFTFRSIIENSASGISKHPENIYLDFKLEQNYPNPFNSSTLINYFVPMSDNIKIKLFNSIGQEMMVLYDGFQSAGNHSLRFTNPNLSSGAYFYQLISSSSRISKKMVLIR